MFSHVIMMTTRKVYNLTKHLRLFDNINHLYAVNYERWMERAVEIYHEVNEVLKQVEGETIRSHESIEENVYQTIYDNGVYVIVNYGLEPVTINGQTIEPQGYLTGGGDR